MSDLSDFSDVFGFRPDPVGPFDFLSFTTSGPAGTSAGAPTVIPTVAGPVFIPAPDFAQVAADLAALNLPAPPQTVPLEGGPFSDVSVEPAETTVLPIPQVPPSPTRPVGPQEPSDEISFVIDPIELDPVAIVSAFPDAVDLGDGAAGGSTVPPIIGTPTFAGGDPISEPSVPAAPVGTEPVSFLGDIFNVVTGAVVGPTGGFTPPFVGGPAAVPAGPSIGSLLGGVIVDELGLGLDNPFAVFGDSPSGGLIAGFPDTFDIIENVAGAFGAGTPTPNVPVVASVPSPQPGAASVAGQVARNLPQYLTCTQWAQAGQPDRYELCGVNANGEPIARRVRRRRRGPAFTQRTLNQIQTLKGVLSPAEFKIVLSKLTVRV